MHSRKYVLCTNVAKVVAAIRVRRAFPRSTCIHPARASLVRGAHAEGGVEGRGGAGAAVGVIQALDALAGGGIAHGLYAFVLDRAQVAVGVAGHARELVGRANRRRRRAVCHVVLAAGALGAAQIVVAVVRFALLVVLAILTVVETGVGVRIGVCVGIRIRVRVSV
jgi:hypothetical protein